MWLYCVQGFLIWGKYAKFKTYEKKYTQYTVFGCPRGLGFWGGQKQATNFARS